MFAATVRGLLATALITASISAFSAPSIPPPSGQVGSPYQVQRVASCGGSGCTIDFPIIPQKRRADLSLANCAVVGTGGLSSMALVLREGTTNLLHHELIQAQSISVGMQTRRLFNDPIQISVAAGRHIRAQVALTSGSVGMRCSLFGTLVVLP